MGYDSKIEWCDHTFNPWTGCTKISPGCAHCYAESWAKRSGLVVWGDQGTRRRTSAANWKEPLKWNEAAKAEGVRKRVFCASLADAMEDRPELAPWRSDLRDMIERTLYLDWLLLTKRPENFERLLPREWLDYPLGNVWLGTTAENQEYADKRIPALLRTPAAVRFLSVEPMLGPVDLVKLHSLDYHKNTIGYETYPLAGLQAVPDCDWEHGKLNWVIVGGESGPGARPCDVAWVRDIVRQCRDAGTACFVKQLGANVAGNPSEFHGTVVTHKGHSRPHLYDRKGGDIKEWPEDLRVREMPAVQERAR